MKRETDIETISSIQDSLEYLAVNYGQLPKLVFQESLYGVKGELELLKENLALAAQASSQREFESQNGHH